MSLIKRLKYKIRSLLGITYTLDQIRLALGRIELNQQISRQQLGLRDNEFQVYSQWGEDGIIQFLIRNIQIGRPIFVEFGVEDYVESNTRFLLQNNNWSGLVIDGSAENIEKIKQYPIYWRFNLKAESAFITKDNINELLIRNDIQGDIGLLSIDLDGNDYWIWDAIDCISPRIVICEYNSLFGAERPVTIPYQGNFVASQAHYSNAYFGASISAISELGQKKGYALVGSNSNGCNAFFVRQDLVGPLQVMTARSAYVQAKFQNSRNEQGVLDFGGFEERVKRIRNLSVIDLANNEQVSIHSLWEA